MHFNGLLIQLCAQIGRALALFGLAAYCRALGFITNGEDAIETFDWSDGPPKGHSAFAGTPTSSFQLSKE